MKSNIFLRSLIAVTMTLVTASTFAEHRVALLISNDTDESPSNDPAVSLRAIEDRLKEFGFRCEAVTNLKNEYAFRNSIESFAARTPTRSTALIFFRGRLADGMSLLAADSRSRYPISKVLQAMSKRGGSLRNILFFEGERPDEIKLDLPLETLVAFGHTQKFLDKSSTTTNLIDALESYGTSRSTLKNGTSVTGRGSQAISHPEQFVSGRKAGDEWVSPQGLVFCWCPPGKFIAGSPESVPGRYPDEAQHEVVIKDGFWLSKFELARSQEISKRRPGRGSIAKFKLDPMTMINHDDAKSMTRNLTASEQKAGRLPQDWQYSLPNEDQWEYAARAGTTTRFYFGDDLSQLRSHANFADRSYHESADIFSNSAHRTLNDGAIRLNLVGSYQPNPWGFHDMYGNVAEWCINLAIRGGSWVSVPQNCRSAYRDSFSSRNEQNFIGYRLVIQKVPAKVEGRR